MDVIPIIMQHLGDKNIKMITPALRTIGNVLSGDDVQTQLCLDNNVLFYLEQLILPSLRFVERMCISNHHINIKNHLALIFYIHP